MIIGNGNKPTPPSLLWPGTGEAYSRGCICPVSENQQRLRMGAKPKLLKNCRIHKHICQAEECGHGSHESTHQRCEHCTNEVYTCVICGGIFFEDEDEDDPDKVGWKLVENDSEAGVRGWRCRRCR